MNEGRKERRKEGRKEGKWEVDAERGSEVNSPFSILLSYVKIEDKLNKHSLCCTNDAYKSCMHHVLP